MRIVCIPRRSYSAPGLRGVGGIGLQRDAIEAPPLEVAKHVPEEGCAEAAPPVVGMNDEVLDEAFLPVEGGRRERSVGSLDDEPALGLEARIVEHEALPVFEGPRLVVRLPGVGDVDQILHPRRLLDSERADRHLFRPARLSDLAAELHLHDPGLVGGLVPMCLEKGRTGGLVPPRRRLDKRPLHGRLGLIQKARPDPPPT